MVCAATETHEGSNTAGAGDALARRRSVPMNPKTLAVADVVAALMLGWPLAWVGAALFTVLALMG